MLRVGDGVLGESSLFELTRVSLHLDYLFSLYVF